MANREFFNKISDTISAAGKDGIGKAKELKGTAKLTLEIKSREGAIHKMYNELGMAYYQDHKCDEASEYADRLTAINAAFEEIAELKASIDEIRGIKRCPCCGEIVSAAARFCASCGERCEEEVVEAEVVEEEVAEEPCCCAEEAPAEEPCCCAEEAPAEEPCCCAEEAPAEEPCCCAEETTEE